MSNRPFKPYLLFDRAIIAAEDEFEKYQITKIDNSQNINPSRRIRVRAIDSSFNCLRKICRNIFILSDRLKLYLKLDKLR